MFNSEANILRRESPWITGELPKDDRENAEVDLVKFKATNVFLLQIGAPWNKDNSHLLLKAA